MKKLVIYSRICPDESKHTCQIFETFKKHDQYFDVLFLDGSKPYNWQEEQSRVKQYKDIIFLYTINWFNLPWSLTRYLAEVWRTFPFSLDGINIHKIITTGATEQVYDKNGIYGWTVNEYMNNFDSCIKKLNGVVGNTDVYYDAVHFNQDKLNTFIDMLINKYK